MDLLENYNELPEPVQAILSSFNEDTDNQYSECKRVVQELEKHGYTAEYDLSGELFDLRYKAKQGDIIEFYISCNADRKLLTGKVEHSEQLGLITIVDGVQYELRKLIDIRK